ncbi:Methylenetetrahydrofolate dehydrogenase [NAD(+)] [Vermiconidia calcicola]|uniref:Methylenetetrahydrofolate dehydrogenase [NAD(+)] n=1 Tax=Vermiconidia calcicola TaxID=1690605 RepID=A0ACC3NDI6_9PEZI|nr:Methylenetetrahydrofolate dehydrogenase [NAD(+)] [Vermiconidia calcicola]
MADPTANGACKVVLAGSIAKSLLCEVYDGLQKLGRQPRLHGFLANQDPAARMYADWTAKTCKENGFDFTLREVDREDLEDEIRVANQDDKVDGTISILPCTPLAIIKILEHLQIYNNFLDYGKRLFGRRITVINRSEVVGRPLAALLANDGAEVYSVDVTGVQQFSRGSGLRKQKHEVRDMDGWGLRQCLPVSEVVISGVPRDEYKVPTDLIREGAVCINLSSGKNFNPDVKEKASIYVPAIGKVTIVILLRNLLRLAEA